MRASAERFEAFLIDWDGTLIDSLPLKIENAAALFSERLGLRPQDVSSSYARHSGVPRRVLFDRISIDCLGRKLTEDEFKRMSAEFTDRNRRRVTNQGSLRMGALAALSEMRDKGALLFISTSAAQDEIDSLAHHFGLDRVCAGIFGSSPSFSKGREHADHVMQSFGLKPDEIAGIGDDVHDMMLFQKAGIYAIGITGTRTARELKDAGAALIVHTLEEVVALAG